MYPWMIFLHILGATVWVGGHLVLALRYLPKALKEKDVSVIRGFEEKFEPVGIPALLIQVVTGIWMAFFHYKVPFMSFEYPFATAVSLKLISLAVIVILAVHARLFIIPRLDEQRLGLMAFHIVVLTLVSVGMVFIGVQFRFGGI